jgi:hypothetical protein
MSDCVCPCSVSEKLQESRAIYFIGTSIYLKPASTVSVRDNSGGGKATVSSHPYANHTAGISMYIKYY